MRRASTVIWCGLLIAFGAYCLMVSRGPVGLKRQLGPPLEPLASGTKFKFAVLGDVHFHRKSLRAALRTAEARGCSFVVQLGDFVDYDDDIEYRRFVRLTADLAKGLPLFLVRGNHETMAPGGGFTDNYSKYINPAHYTFKFGGQFFGVLDDSSGVLARAQLEELRSTLRRFRSSHPESRAFLFLHAPPDLPGLNSPDCTDGSSADLLRLAREMQIDFVFAGNVHDYAEMRVENTTYVITGCGGGSFGAPSTEVHYVEVSVSPAGVTTRRVPLPRDSRIVASAAHLVSVAVPRFRWHFFTGTLLLLAWELARARLLSRKIGRTRPDTAKD